MLPLDLHVLSLSLAFILSQDQTLHCTFIFFIRLSLNSSFIVVKFYDGGILLPCTYTTFLLFQIFKESLSFHSAAISLDCGCKGTTFFENTKLFVIKNFNYFSFA